MTAHIAPDAPGSLPTYLGEGLPKQDIETLEKARAFIDELIEYKHRPVPESEVPADAAVVETAGESGQKGTISVRKNPCGDETCHCMTEGELHGPYTYLAYRDGKGNVVTDYQGPATEP